MSESSPYHLKHLTVDLFAYDLHASLGEIEEQIEDRRTKFWSRFYPDGLPKNSNLLEKIKNREKQEINYIELLDEPRVKLPHQPGKPEPNGYYLPALLGDNYLTLIDSSGDMCSRGQPQPIDNLKSIRDSIKTYLHHPAEIGQSWFVWGQLVTDDQVNTGDVKKLAIAQACYQAIYQGLKPEVSASITDIRAGCWRQANLFEQQHLDHTLIALFPSHAPNFKTDRAKLQRHLAHLFCFRHKILWAYKQSRELVSDLKATSSEIQALVAHLPTDSETEPLHLKDLQTKLAKALKLFASCSIQVNKLGIQHHTIETNLANYSDRLTQMKDDDQNADLQLFREFETYANQIYLKQAEIDYRVFGTKLSLLENTISTISGVSQLEQTKRDRRLNETVAVAGVWVGTASAAASLITPVTASLTGESAQPNSAPPSFTSKLTTFGLSLFLSLGIGLVAALLWKTRQRSQ